VAVSTRLRPGNPVVAHAVGAEVDDTWAAADPGSKGATVWWLLTEKLGALFVTKVTGEDGTRQVWFTAANMSIIIK